MEATMPGLSREKLAAEIRLMGEQEDIGRQPEHFHERLAEILIRRFGLDGRPPLSPELIADGYGITTRRMHVLEARALKCLRDRFLNDGCVTHGAVSIKHLRNILRNGATKARE